MSVHAPHKKRQNACHSNTSRVLAFGDRTVTTHGLRRHVWGDIYHYAMTARWPIFIATVAALFLLLNTLFALAFLARDQAIANLSPSGFLGAFFFSVETLATVGYGDMHPQTIYGHVVATSEIFVGQISIALITGVMFARFSRPRARIMFADVAMVGPYDGKQTLIIRIANARQNVIIDASARLRLLRLQISPEGVKMRRLYDLDLVRDQNPILLLGWSIMHVIDETSPLFGATAETLAHDSAVLILTVDGIDETTTQTMISRRQYEHQQILWQHRYVDVLSTDELGTQHVDYRRFHDAIPI